MAPPDPGPRVQALQGVRVVEFSSAMAGPWIGRFMAYFGAEVIRVESRKRPDVVRQYIPPWAPEQGIQPQLSPWFTDWNAGKRFVALDLTHPRSVEISKQLVACCDVVVENQSAGVMDKLGLGYGDLEPVKPDIIMLSSSGYGDSGPCHRYVTWGPNIETLSGLSHLSGFPERECTMTQYAYPDPLSALHGLFAVLCALDYRTRSGRGQYIGLSQLEVTVAAIGEQIMQSLAGGAEPEKLGNRSLHAAPHGCYPCQGEDSWCALSVADEAEWGAFCSVLGEPGWRQDPRFDSLAARLRNREELDRRIEAWTRPRTAQEVMRILQEGGVAAGVVQTVEDLARRDRQLAERGFFEELEHEVKGKVVATGIPVRLTGTPGRSGRAGAAVGQDNTYVFEELLGMTPSQVQEAIELGAIEPTGS